MTYRYFEWESRLYRAPEADLSRMELRNPRTKLWERYRGDIARVLMEATHLSEQPRKV